MCEQPMVRGGNALRLLTHVFAAVDHGSLRQAAKALRVRESSVSRNVVKLEQLLEVQLFERDVRGVKLTEPGRAWVGVARTHYDGLLDACMGAVAKNRDAKSIRIGLCWVTGSKFFKHLINRFSHLYPDVSLTIEDVEAGQCMAAIRRRHIDIAFGHDLGEVNACSSEVFWQERLFVLLPSGHALVQRQAVAWSDLADMCLLVPAGVGGRPFEMRLLQRIAANGGPAVQTCRANLATVILRAQLGQGIVLAPESYARAVAVEPATWKPLQGQDSVSPISGVWLESNPTRPVLRLIAVARNLAPAGGVELERRHATGVRR